jgi:hypothetical protein
MAKADGNGGSMAKYGAKLDAAAVGDLVDIAEQLVFAVRGVRDAVTPVAAPGQDAAGGTVASLTEAVMGVTAGLCQIAEAIHALAGAVRSRDDGEDEPFHS